MMKKVAIVTIIDFNYGNRLQNYALQTVLEKNGVNVETLMFEKLGIKCKIKRLIQSYLKKNRYGAFLRFNRKIHFSNFSINSGNELPEEFEKVIAGSDQIWNIEFPGISENCFLAFVPKEKRFSYAASFGISIEEKYRYLEYPKLLSEFPCISVRERSGAEMIKKLTGKQAEVVLDPVFLLDAKEWEKVAHVSKEMPTRPYIFCYFLGQYTEEYRKRVKKIAEREKCEIFVLKPGLKELENDVGPAEFIDLIKNSVAVCADSYHAIVFSMIFGVQSYLFNREDNQNSMNSRFETLFELFNIKLDEDKCLNYDRESYENELKTQKSKSIDILLRGINK